MLNLNETKVMIKRGAACIALSAVLLVANVGSAQAQQAPEYQCYLYWAWNDWATGGSTCCPAQYVVYGVGQFVAGTGRAGLLRYAAGASFVNPDFAFRLALLSQCHNPGAQQVLMQAGPGKVLSYLRCLASNVIIPSDTVSWPWWR